MESLAFCVHFLQHYNSNSLKKPFTCQLSCLLGDFTCQLSCLLGDFAAWTLMTPSKHEILQNFLIIWCAFWFHFLDNKWLWSSYGCLWFIYYVDHYSITLCGCEIKTCWCACRVVLIKVLPANKTLITSYSLDLVV